MISSRSSSTQQPQQAVKSLSTTLPTEEAKTPEIETVLQHNEEVVAAPEKETHEEEEKEIEEAQPLSTRAQRVKDSLRNESVVRAVLLKADGTSQEIGYNTSSKQANELLHGRPSIVGELEDLNVVIARSLNQSQSEVNSHVLPAPFCNKSYKGNYLLYRVDAKGSPIDLELSQYETYVNDNKTSTENARKNFDPVDNQEIKAKSSFNSNSTLTLACLRSEVDKKVREEFKSENERKPTQTEIEEAVDESLQRLVDQLASSCSKLNDPDYEPQEDMDHLEESDLYHFNEAMEQDADYDDDKDWRLQLKDALNFVRQRGRIDGRILAEKISQTFYELNGEEATLDELVDVFRRIKGALADEAEQDLQEDVHDNGTALYLAQKLGADLKNADPSDIVDISFRVVGQDLVYRAKSSFLICRGRAPNQEELSQAVHKLAVQLADRAIAESDDFDIDCDYDPHNESDGELAKQDELENEEWQNDSDNNFNLKMLKSQQVDSKTGAATSYNVYFYKPNAKRQRNNLSAAISSFKKRNGRAPDSFELNRLRQFMRMEHETSVVQFKVSVDSDADSHEAKEEKEFEESQSRKKVATTPSKVLVTPVKKKKSAARYNVYFEQDALDKERNETLAIKWFQRFNNREPSQLELTAIKQFVKSDKSQVTEVEYDVPLEDDLDDGYKAAAKLKTDSLVEKKSSTKYTLNFDDQEERENGDENQAIKWFKRFNNRDPTDEEKEKIKHFIKSDDADTIDVD